MWLGCKLMGVLQGDLDGSHFGRLWDLALGWSDGYMSEVYSSFYPD